MLMFVGIAPVTLGQNAATEGTAGQMTIAQLKSIGNAFSPGVSGFDNRYQGVKGHPFYVDAWVTGKLEVFMGYGKKVQTYEGLQIKYDVYANQIAVANPETRDTFYLNDHVVKSFQLHLPDYTTPVEFIRAPEVAALDDKQGNAFFAVLHKNKTTLLRKTGKIKIEANYKGAYSANKPYDELMEEVQYFLVRGGKAQRVKLSRKSVIDALADHKEEVKLFLSKEKIGIKTEQDLIRVLAFYDSL